MQKCSTVGKEQNVIGLSRTARGLLQLRGPVKLCLGQLAEEFLVERCKNRPEAPTIKIVLKMS